MSDSAIGETEKLIDVFGAIDSDVYVEGQRIWERLKNLSRRMLGDEHEGHQLLMRACAEVTRVRSTRSDEIRNLPAYLEVTWRHMAIAELRKKRKRSELNLKVVEDGDTGSIVDHTLIEQGVLIRELVSRMDDWSREIFELRVLGYTFDEIGVLKKRNGNALRSRWSKAMRKIVVAINKESRRRE